ncbi:hypothetical protein GTR02_05825 [Kineococcus sp. R8]|uniref:hypothetical protein n=1 Tax=Kineococcus siccus TaxID=2696567 RepID=UPI0014128E13|nr:hypothetical protein [Kineococcus siccus]NAZ81330.1 hypothetical protein [Kineococcus siccus]
MPFYADAGPRRVRQVTGDLLLVVGVLAAGWLGRTVRAAVAALADPALSFAAGATGLAQRLRDAGEQAGDTPLVGDELARPLDAASSSAGSLAAAGREQAGAVQDLARTLGLATALIPIALLLLLWGLPRLRWLRRARSSRRLAATPGGDTLLALRALQGGPDAALLAVHPDPAAAWRAGDPAVVRALADLQLRSVGVTRRAAGTTGAVRADGGPRGAAPGR